LVTNRFDSGETGTAFAGAEDAGCCGEGFAGVVWARARAGAMARIARLAALFKFNIGFLLSRIPAALDLHAYFRSRVGFHFVIPAYFLGLKNH
jgi:hypothetical protein